MPELRWRFEELPWHEMDRSRIDPELIPVVKAASVVEFNADDYTAYLCNVFRDDPEFCRLARDWAVEEVQHGHALGRWAELADPGFEFGRAVARFRAGYRVPVDRTDSVRGSRSGELIARCIVETGTSSYYAAMADRTEEPLLRRICRNIAADELRHYKLFYTQAQRYLEQERLGRLRRLLVALRRINESEDDELAYAYFAANAPEDSVYDRATWNRAYARRAYGMYRRQHMDRAVAMIFKACGLKPHTRLFDVAARGAWWMVESRVRRLEAGSA